MRRLRVFGGKGFQQWKKFRFGLQEGKCSWTEWNWVDTFEVEILFCGLSLFSLLSRWGTMETPWNSLWDQMFDEMISSSSLMERAPLLAWLVFILMLGVCFGSPNPNHRVVCWKAIFKCQAEQECHYAYNQYLHACASVLSGERKKCPSHCISSLIQLNLTRSGPALEDCDCAADPRCRSTKQAIEPCVPRTSTMGCTEARLQCGLDPACSSAMQDYLFHCRKLFGGQRCTESCRRTIADMRSIPKAQQLDTCVCDGTERNICEYIKVSMRTLCFDSREGSGFAYSDEDAEDDYFDLEDYPSAENACASAPFLTFFHILTIIFVSKFI